MASDLGALGEVVSDRTLVLNLIRGLNERFANIGLHLRRSQPFPSFLEAKEALRLEELTFAHQTTTPTALVATQSAAPPPAGGTSNSKGGGGSGSGGAQAKPSKSRRSKRGGGGNKDAATSQQPAGGAKGGPAACALANILEPLGRVSPDVARQPPSPGPTSATGAAATAGPADRAALGSFDSYCSLRPVVCSSTG